MARILDPYDTGELWALSCQVADELDGRPDRLAEFQRMLRFHLPRLQGGFGFAKPANPAKNPGAAKAKAAKKKAAQHRQAVAAGNAAGV